MFLNVDRVSLRYAPATSSARPAVEDVSLRLGAGQIGVLIGPSGCGKTSLLRCIAGLERPTAGVIAMGDRVLSSAGASRDRPSQEVPSSRTGPAGDPPPPILHLAPEDRQIGMVFQDYALFPHLSVADNIAFGIRRLAAAERRARVSELLDLVGLAHAAQRAPHQLSGGQQQRIALARALAPRPQLLLLDEPFSSLDVDLRERLAHDLRGILKSTGTTALFVTHDQLEAFALGDVIGVMNQGHLEQWDTPYELYHRPATRFVAQFIGHAVFTPAQIVTCAHGPCVHTPLGEIDNPDECPLPSAYPNGECDVLLRADDIVHDDDSPVKARIELKAFRGSEFLYTLRLDSGEQVLTHVPSHHDHHVGERIGIRLQMDHVVTFSREDAASATLQRP